MATCAKKFRQFVATVGKTLHKPNRRFLRDALYGILNRRSVLLSEIGRALNEPRRLIHTEKRLSRGLGSARFDDLSVERAYLREVSDYLFDSRFPTPVIAVDLSDIAKPRARKMPLLGRVYDGSEGKVALGYHIATIEAVGTVGRRMPLCSRLFSAEEEGFKSQNNVVLEAIDFVRSSVPRDALWVFDRGFDGHRTYDALDERTLLYVVRQDASKKRRVWIGGKKVPMSEMASAVPPTFQFRAKRFSDKAKRSWLLKVGWVNEVSLEQRYTTGPGRNRPVGTSYHSVVVAHGTSNKDPLILLTNVPVRDAADAEKIVNAYMDRWGVEEAHRFVKQAFDLENLRALSWRGLKRLVLLAILAYGFAAVLVHGSRFQIDKLARTFKAFGDVPIYLYYRILEGIPRLLRGVLRSGP
jgi:hypothetical protein